MPLIVTSLRSNHIICSGTLWTGVDAWNRVDCTQRTNSWVWNKYHTIIVSRTYLHIEAMFILSMRPHKDARTYARTYAQTHARSHAYTRVHTSARMHARLHARTYSRPHTCTLYAHTYACTHARMHTCTHAHMHICTHAHMHTCTHAHMHTCAHAHMHTCTHAHMHTCTHAHMHTCTHAHMYTCTCTCARADSCLLYRLIGTVGQYEHLATEDAAKVDHWGGYKLRLNSIECFECGVNQRKCWTLITDLCEVFICYRRPFTWEW